MRSTEESASAYSPAPRRPGETVPAGQSRGRRLARYLARRAAVLVALLILFYATSLHGINARTFILAGILVIFLYWLFKRAL